MTAMPVVRQEGQDKGSALELNVYKTVMKVRPTRRKSALSAPEGVVADEKRVPHLRCRAKAVAADLLPPRDEGHRWRQRGLRWMGEFKVQEPQPFSKAFLGSPRCVLYGK